jgi:hypothetical protein
VQSAYPGSVPGSQQGTLDFERPLYRAAVFVVACKRISKVRREGLQSMIVMPVWFFLLQLGVNAGFTGVFTDEDDDPDAGEG